MNHEKLDTTLNLSLETDIETRNKSQVLSNGVDETAGTWEVIVKYHGDIGALGEIAEAIDVLINGYAIMRVTKQQLERLVTYEQIEFVELPKSMQFNTYRAKQASCVFPLTVSGTRLSGRGVLIGIVDSGIDYLLRDFQNETGSRILYLWDQTLSESDRIPEGFSKGAEYRKEDIDRAIQAAGRVDNAIVEASGRNGLERNGATMSSRQRAYEIVPSRDLSGHGTAVAGIAAGSSVSPLYQGVAPGSELIIVKLAGNMGRMETGRQITNFGTQVSRFNTDQNFPLTTDLMRGITYVMRKAEELGRPIVLNISIGDTYGAHDGTSLLERFIDSVCDNGRNTICIGSGNEAVSNGHTSFVLNGEERIELSIAERERGTNVQLWKNYVDDCTLELEAPGGNRYTVNTKQRGKQTWKVGNTTVLIYVSPPKPFTVNEEIFFDFIPQDEFIDDGIWTFVLSPVNSNQHDYHMYLPNSRTRNTNTRFVTPTPQLTMTIPAFASRALTVGAYDIVTNSYADFSGRDRNIGEEERSFFAADVKPDIAAPGVDITAPATGGGYASFTGTSFATPIVTGSVALLMEWGIIRGNDLFLYGEKVKAYLRKGAKPLGGEVLYPNPRNGWGALCVADSIN